MHDLPRIFVYVKWRSAMGTPQVLVAALAEDGTELATASMPSDRFLASSMRRLDRVSKFRAHYPEGFQLETVWKPEEHADLQEALRRAAA